MQQRQEQYDDFKPVGRKHGARAAVQRSAPSASSSTDLSSQRGFRYRNSGSEAVALPFHDQVKKIEIQIDEIQRSLQRQKLFSILNAIFGGDNPRFRPTEIVCYGIGPFSTSRIARIQLALILLLKSACKFDNVLLFDPALSSDEKRILREVFHISLIEKNELGKRSVALSPGRTLFYMPHCPKQMYSNLLFANWSASQLARICIIGNSFSNYVLRTISATARAKYIFRIEPHCTEIPLSYDYEFEAFNDTCVTLFEPEKLSAIGADFWANHEEEPLDPNDRELVYSP